MTSIWRLLQLMRPVLGWMLLGGALSFITLIANVVLMATSGWFIASMAIAGIHGVTLNYFTPAAIIRLSAILRTTGRYAERLVSHSATLRILSQLRVWFYERIEPLAPAGLEGFRSGDLLSRIRADIDTLDQFYLRLLLPFIVALMASLTFVLFLIWIDPMLALIEFALLLTAGVILPIVSNRTCSNSSRQINEINTALRAHLINDLQGMGELLIDAADKPHAQRIDQLSQELVTHQKRISHINGLTQGGVGLSANLAMWLILITTIPMVQQAELPPAQLVMLILFTLASFEAVAPLPFAMQSLGELLTATKRIFSLVDRLPTITEPVNPIAISTTTDQELTLFNVSYRYTQQKPAGVQDISLQLTPGKRIALVGPSGCGKSTLVQLLLKFRAPDKGEVSLGGIPYDQLNGDSIRQQIAVAFQQTHLFNSTIRDNLLLANPNADQAMLESVCRTAVIHDFILAQPAGYDTLVGELGIRISSGQARRLAVARALLKGAPLLILDEPTESLDALTEQQLVQNILQECQNQAILWITHRLTGLESMDEILVMHDGQIVERGKPEQLAMTNSLYAKMQAQQILLGEEG
ncbi:MAG: thiol reductant ABC exporter subunit CydC [Candidatus Thiodiazotropha sp.]|jgi:ATP-binding cassette, subfamily C, bacterial CydC